MSITRFNFDRPLEGYPFYPRRWMSQNMRNQFYFEANMPTIGIKGTETSFCDEIIPESYSCDPFQELNFHD